VQIKRRTCPEEVPDGFFCVMGGCEGRLGRGRAAPINIPRFLVQNIPMNLRKAEIVCASGLHDFRSFISIAQKETLHI